MKAIYLLFAICYLLFIVAADAVTPTPKPGDVGVKAEVKGPSPSLSASTTPTPSTVSASPSAAQQTGEEPAKKSGEDEEARAGIPKAEIQEESKVPGSFIEEAIEQADNLLIKDNSWIKLLGLAWLIFIAFIVFLYVKHRKTQTPSQTPAGAPSGGEPVPPVSETRESSPPGRRPSGPEA